jgi:membrane protease YdiL (CAAX protease family)
LATNPEIGEFFAAFAALALFSGALAIFAAAVSHLVRTGGRVEAGHFGLPDVLTGGVLVLYMLGGIAAVLFTEGGAHEPVSLERLLPQQMFVVAMVAGLSGFLIYRRMNPARLFGLGRLSVGATLGLAVIFLLAALPIVGVTNQLTVLMLRDLADEQELVGLFRELVRAGDPTAIGKAFVAAAVVAPVCEEFIFRGYFYGIGKRYFGSLASAMATSLLFAAIHLNLASLPGLFVLALCLTAAYERTGSLLVPMGVHALYNTASLVAIYLQAQGRLPELTP